MRYPHAVVVERSGAPDAPIVYDGNAAGDWGEGRAILDGSRPLGPWTRDGDAPGGLAIWRAPLAPLRASRAWTPGEEDRPALFQGDRLGRMASSADREDNWMKGDMRPFRQVDRDRITDRTLADPDALAGLGAGWDQALIELQHGNSHLDLFRVLGFDPASGTLTHEPTKPLRAGRPHYAVVNHPGVFDAPGEYLIDAKADALFYIPFDGADPNDVDIGFAAVGSGVRNIGASHIVIRGFRMTKHRHRGVALGSNRSLDRLRDVTVEDNEMVQGGGVMLVRTDASVVRGNYINEVLRDQPILVRRSDQVIVADNVTRRGNTGITASGATNSLFIGNDARASLGLHGNALTIYEGSHNTWIIGNLIQSGLGPIGLALRQSDRLVIAFNAIRGRRFAVAQWAQVEGGDKLDFFNNAFLGNVRIQPDSAARARFVNNFIGTFELQRGLESIPVRVHNVYGRIGQASVQRAQLREGEALLAPETAFRFEDGDPLDVRPAPSGRKRLGDGAPYDFAGNRVTHVGVYDLQGRRPDLGRIGLPPHDPDLVHR